MPIDLGYLEPYQLYKLFEVNVLYQLITLIIKQLHFFNIKIPLVDQQNFVQYNIILMPIHINNTRFAYVQKIPMTLYYEVIKRVSQTMGRDPLVGPNKIFGGSRKF